MSVEALEDILIARYAPDYEHYIDEFEYDGIEKELADVFDIKKIIKNYVASSDAYVAIVNEKMIGIAGIAPLWPGVGNAWMFLNKAAKRYIKTIFKKTKEVIEAELSYRYHRIQALCLDMPETKRLIERLGFEKEGVMRKTVCNRNMIMYARLRRE